MALNPQEKPERKQLPLPKEGVIPARVARIVEIGKHQVYTYGDKHLVQIWYSLPTRLIEDPTSEYNGKQSMVKTKRMTKSSDEKASLMDHVRAVKPSARSLGELLDQPCYIDLKHNTVNKEGENRTYANIMNVMAVPEGIQVGPLDTTPFYFDYDNPDPDVWSKNLWDDIRDLIKASKDYKGSKVEAMVLRLEAMAK